MKACEVLRVGGEGAFDILMHRGSLHREGLANEANVSPCIGKPSERDVAPAPREALPVPSEARRQAPAAVGIGHLPGGALPQRRIAMLRMMACVEARLLGCQVGPVAEGLAPPEELVIHPPRTLQRTHSAMASGTGCGFGPDSRHRSAGPAPCGRSLSQTAAARAHSRHP
jgi:hypothetical protein